MNTNPSDTPKPPIPIKMPINRSGGCYYAGGVRIVIGAPVSGAFDRLLAANAAVRAAQPAEAKPALVVWRDLPMLSFHQCQSCLGYVEALDTSRVNTDEGAKKVWMCKACGQMHR